MEPEDEERKRDGEGARISFTNPHHSHSDRGTTKTTLSNCVEKSLQMMKFDLIVFVISLIRLPSGIALRKVR